MINRPDVLRFLAAHHWVATIGQLDDLGMGKEAIKHARRQGLFVTPARGLVALASVELTFEGRAMAVQLAAGHEAFVSGPSAGVLHGLRSMPRARVEVTILERRRATLPPWGRLVRTSWLDEECDVTTRADGLRIATPLRTLFGLAAQFNQHRFERAAEDVWHHGLVSPEQAADYLDAVRRSGRTGVGRFETWLEKTSVRGRPSQSGLELDFVDLIEKVGLPTAVRQHPLVLPTGETIHLDLAWPGVQLAVEPGHSWWHGGDLRMKLDAGRDRACDEIGWRVIRYDEDAKRDPIGTARQLLTIYRRRLAMLNASDDSSGR